MGAENRPKLLALLLAAIMVLTVPIAPAHQAEAEGSGGGGIMAATLQDYTALSTGLATVGDYNYLSAGDINGDGYCDVVAGAGQYPSGSVDTYGIWAYTYNSNNDTWTKNSSGLPTTGTFGGVGLGDLDGDGDLDIAVGGESWGGSAVKGVVVYLNDGTVSGKLSWSAGTKPEANNYYDQVVISDVNKDGDADIVAATHGNGIKVWAGDGGSGGTFTWTAKNTGLPTTGEFTGISVVDMNGDGKKDIIATDYNGAKPPVHLWTGDGSGSWTSRDANFTSTSTENTFGVNAGDFNADGYMDIVYGMQSSGLVVLLGNGGGSNGGGNFSWTAVTSGLPTSGTYTENAVKDMDRDGDLDIVTARPSGGVELYQGNGGAGGTMRFTKAAKKLPTSGTYYGACVGDFNKDKTPDVAGSMWQEGTSPGGIRAWKGNVTGLGDPTARAFWDGTTVNATTIYRGNPAKLNGTKSFDGEDCPGGDANGTILTYEWNLTKRPAGSTLTDSSLSPSDKNATPSFTPDRVGNYSLSLVVKDSDGRWSESTAYVELQVLRPNDPPVADAGADQSVFSGALVTLDGTGSSDADGTLLAWQWNASITNPAAVNLQNATLPEAKFQAPITSGLYRFILKVRDNNDTWSAPDEVVVTVSLPPNIAPVARAGNDFQATVNRLAKLNGSASYDPDGVTVAAWEWKCTNRPSLPITGADAMEASFTPVLPGKYNFTLRVQDDRGDWSPLARVNVTAISEAVNVPPVAEILGAAVRSAYVGSDITIDGSSSHDDDGAVVVYKWNCTSHPTLAFQGQNTTQITFKSLEPADFLFTLAVRDDNSTWSLHEATVTVHVVRPPVNALPVSIIEGPPSPQRPGVRISLDASTSYDPDGVVVNFRWTCLSHPSLVFTGQGTSFIQYTPDDTGDYTLRLEVQDDLSAWSTNLASFTVSVRVNERPVANISGPRTGVPNENVTLSASVSKDPDGTVVAWRWEITDPAGFAMTGADMAEMTFKPSSARSYVVSLVVQDNEDAWSASAEWTVVVGKVDHLPTANAGADSTIRVSQSVQLTGAASRDQEGPIMEYLWKCTSHPSVGGFLNADMMIASFTPSSPADYTFSLEVRDNAGQWSTPDTVKVKVLPPNQAPVVTLLRPLAGTVSLVNERLVVEWTASDANGDSMRFTVEIYKDKALLTRMANLPSNTRNITFNDSTTYFPRNMMIELVLTAREYGTEDQLSTTVRSGAFSIIDSATHPPQQQDEKSNKGLLIGLLLLLVVIVIIGYLAAGRRGGGSKDAPPPAPAETAVGPAPARSADAPRRGAVARTVAAAPAAAEAPRAAARPKGGPVTDPRGRLLDCPQCGAPLDHDNDFGRPYCEECDKYF